jgi:hypothetical protein
MTALTNDRNTIRSEGGIVSLDVAAATTIFAGAIVMRNSAGYATKGSTALNLIGVGRAEEQVKNAGSAGDLTIKVRPGTFCYNNSAPTDQISAADIGLPAYVVDDQTVAKTDGSGTRSIAGFVENVDSQGVWVRFDEVASRGYTALESAIADIS